MLNKVRIVTDSEGRTRIFINGAEIFSITNFSIAQEGGEDMFPVLRLTIRSPDFEFDGTTITNIFLNGT